MTTKLFEVRDRGTTMPMIGIAIDLKKVVWNSREAKILQRAGYGPDRLVLFGSLEGGPFHYDPYSQPPGARTRHFAHAYVEEHWSELENGAIVDVEFILGETAAPKTTDL